MDQPARFYFIHDQKIRKHGDTGSSERGHENGRGGVYAEGLIHANGLPLGLAHGMKLKRAIPRHQLLQWDDVLYDERAPAIAFRREMEDAFSC